MGTRGRRIRPTIVDTLAFWNNELETHTFNPEVKATHSYWFRVRDDWLASGALPPDRLEVLLRHIYGPNWRWMNEDGSKYIVLSHEVAVLTPQEERQRGWNDPCYVVSEPDQIARVQAEEF